ncbi:MAG TPA: O-antigen ligase family protein [Chitinophagaceae bacterium]|nr:O-antigen ligase family protein [Chitinophagaceae bacterium]
MATNAFKYFIALVSGIIVGDSLVPDNVMVILYLGYSLYCLFLAFKGDLEKLFTVLPYFIYTEIYIRGFPSSLPNLYADYSLAAIFGLLLLRKGTVFRLHSISFIFMGLYALIEIIDSSRTTETDFARINSLNSLNVFIISLWASSTILPLSTLNKLLNNLKIAGIFIGGVVLTVHLFGRIQYTSVSNFAASNGLAPVQLSAYLGLGIILLFLSAVNPFEKKDFVLNIFFISLMSALMVLTFSRGGLYFCAAILILYLFFNRKNLGSYFIFLLLLPVGYLVYYYTVSTTGGLIIDRYEQSGSSGRDILIKIGFEIFKSEPLAGIGTGNFSKEIVARHLYDVESGAHNEFVRAAAEHGILGILTNWFFYIITFIEILRKKKGIEQQYAIYFFVLFCLIIVHNGLKIALQPLLLTLVFVKPAFAVRNKGTNDQRSYKQPA